LRFWRFWRFLEILDSKMQVSGMTKSGKKGQKSGKNGSEKSGFFSCAFDFRLRERQKHDFWPKTRKTLKNGQKQGF